MIKKIAYIVSILSVTSIMYAMHPVKYPEDVTVVNNTNQQIGISSVISKSYKPTTKIINPGQSAKIPLADMHMNITEFQINPVGITQYATKTLVIPAKEIQNKFQELKTEALVISIELAQLKGFITGKDYGKNPLGLTYTIQGGNLKEEQFSIL